MAYFPNWVLYQADAQGVDPEDIFGPPIEEGSHEDQRERFKRKRHQEMIDYVGNEMRIGMVDQASADPDDGSPNLDELIEFAEEVNIAPSLIGYLHRIRRFTTEDLKPVLQRMTAPREVLLRFIPVEEWPDEA